MLSTVVLCFQTRPEAGLGIDQLEFDRLKAKLADEKGD